MKSANLTLADVLQKALVLSLALNLLTSCTTVYKVDANGVCHDPQGRVVKAPDPDAIDHKVKNWNPNPFYSKEGGGAGSGGPNSEYRFEDQVLKDGEAGSTAFGN